MQVGLGPTLKSAANKRTPALALSSVTPSAEGCVLAQRCTKLQEKDGGSPRERTCLIQNILELLVLLGSG